jgi:hypothetical protein
MDRWQGKGMARPLLLDTELVSDNPSDKQPGATDLRV